MLIFRPLNFSLLPRLVSQYLLTLVIAILLCVRRFYQDMLRGLQKGNLERALLRVRKWSMIYLFPWAIFGGVRAAALRE